MGGKARRLAGGVPGRAIRRQGLRHVLYHGEDRPRPTASPPPYDEIFIIRQGRARFTVGDEQLEAGAGQVVFGPANVPHTFVNLGPGPLETTDIHVTDVFIQEDLE